MLVVPHGASADNCSSTGCVADLNESCPPELEVTSADGETVGCISACAAFDRPRLCCTGDNSSPEACKPTSYSENMKKVCPNVYSYAYDDANSTFTCTSADYLITFCSTQNIRDQVTVGDSLTAGDVTEPWVSPSGDFAFGFQQLEKKDLYLLAIWYNKIPDRTIVWYANGDNPVPTRSKVELTSDRGIVLTSPESKEIWSSSISTGEAAYGLMDDTGNFMVTSTTTKTLWQSFEDPRDTLLPGQTLERGGRILNSRLRETNFSLGNFQFCLIRDGNGVLNFNNLSTAFAYDAYYWTNTVDSNVSNAGFRIVFNESGYLYVLRASDIRELITPGRVVSATEYYHRVVLHFDGVLAQYSYPKNSNSSNVKWEVIFGAPNNICNSLSEIGAGPCGFNGVCNLIEDHRATCACPPRFSLLDPNDEYGGCKPDFHTQFCEDDGPNTSEDFEFVELTNTDWPTSNYERYQPYNMQDCQKACLQDYFCNVIVFRGSTCWKKKLPLSNGTQDERVSGRAFIKVRKGLPPRGKKKHDGLVLLVSLFLGGSLFLNFILFILLGFCSCHFRRNKSKAVAQSCKSNLLHFSYMELVKPTNEFNEELGRGSFGIVYKGLIGNEVPIAVKKLDRAVEDSEKEFRTEVEVIGQTHHKNLVKLVGFCDEGQHRLLVYEFMSNGPLSNSLFGDTKLSWEQRIQIAFGVAKGLMYLHEECSTQIIHCDIKPQNILLDENHNAKIADFGLAKLLKLDQSRTFTAIRGTKGYVAPEWFRNTPVTPIVDVFSFGVLLLEIICCRRNVDSKLSGEEAILIDWAYDCFAEDKLDVLVGNDEEAMDDMKKVERFLMVAIWCIQEDSNLRPTMKMVLLMLEGIVQVTAPPSPYPSSAIAN
ncbi:G-type lectin S-receptor-like serine/threonine-protein kinase LECRK4 [Euphorbia lathyris]|uniref:G-type lectin S-receptor-like serine/threonine-protein kinase LECRK4 n=1 Tax=Euphorbia lathyris TaxID=212925 RepID=UPI0033141B79